MAIRTLDRKAKRAVASAAFLLVAVPLIGIVRYVGGHVHAASVVAPNAPSDRLVMFDNGTTVLLPHGSVIAKMTDWLEGGTAGDETFQLSGDAFVTGSDKITQAGWHRLSDMVELLKGYSGIKARIVIPTDANVSGHADPAELRLAEARAFRIRNEALRLGLPADKIEIVKQGASEGASPDAVQHAGKGGELFVVLERRAA